MTKILVLTEHDSIENIQALLLSLNPDVMSLCFWCDEDIFINIIGGLEGKEIIRLNEIVKDYNAYLEKAYYAAHHIAEGSPHYRSVRPLISWEESMTSTILSNLIISDFHQALV